MTLLRSVDQPKWAELTDIHFGLTIVQLLWLHPVRAICIVESRVVVFVKHTLKSIRSCMQEPYGQVRWSSAMRHASLRVLSSSFKV